MSFLRSIFLFFVCASFANAGPVVDFTWKLKHKCALVSPELSLTEIPDGTVELSVTMVDHDFRSFDHGGGLLKNEGGFPAMFKIPEGSLQSYRGPCPPNFYNFGHDYEFTVKAVGKDGNVLGVGSLKKTFNSRLATE